MCIVDYRSRVNFLWPRIAFKRGTSAGRRSWLHQPRRSGVVPYWAPRQQSERLCSSGQWSPMQGTPGGASAKLISKGHVASVITVLRKPVDDETVIDMDLLVTTSSISGRASLRSSTRSPRKGLHCRGAARAARHAPSPFANSHALQWLPGSDDLAWHARDALPRHCFSDFFDAAFGPDSSRCSINRGAGHRMPLVESDSHRH
jgi:hypothetical protein